MKTLKLTKTTSDNIIKEAVSVLKSGGIIIYPTETVYGVGVDPTNREAVNKLLKYKSRREGKPLSIAVSDKEMASKYVQIAESAENIYNNLLPGPITVVSKSNGLVAKGVESEHGTLGVRVPDYSLIREIISAFKKPITASSANASYKKRPYKISDILDNLSKKQKSLIGLIIDAGELPKNDPSTVIDTTLDSATVLRQGEVHLTNKVDLQSSNPEETRKIGADLIKKYSQYLGYKSVIIALKGDLGAGKTEMTKGIAKELGIESKIKSPTFVIEHIYSIPSHKESFVKTQNIELIHMDTWRLFDSEELEELEFYKQVDNVNVFVIEWADKIIDALQKVSAESVIVWVDIEYGKKDTERNISISDFNK